MNRELPAGYVKDGTSFPIPCASLPSFLLLRANQWSRPIAAKPENSTFNDAHVHRNWYYTFSSLGWKRIFRARSLVTFQDGFLRAT